MWETRLKWTRNRLFFGQSWAQLASPPSFHSPSPKALQTQLQGIYPWEVQRSTGWASPGFTARKGRSSDPGATGHMEKGIRLQLDPAGLLKRRFSAWTKGWPCTRCWKPWKSQKFEGAHLCPTPLATTPPYSCSSRRVIGPWDFGEGPLDLERIKRISEMISLIKFLFSSCSNTA